MEELIQEEIEDETDLVPVDPSLQHVIELVGKEEEEKKDKSSELETKTIESNDSGLQVVNVTKVKADMSITSNSQTYLNFPFPGRQYSESEGNLLKGTKYQAVSPRSPSSRARVSSRLKLTPKRYDALLCFLCVRNANYAW